MAKDPAILAHQEWLGYVQPSGLVVSIPAMIEARVYVNRNISPDHQRFLSALPTDRDGEPVPEIANFAEFARSVFGWASEDLYGAPGAPALPETLEAPLPAYGETLRPTYALHDFQPTDPAREWILLIEVLPGGTDLDSLTALEARRWQASPQARFERLLRETGIGIGLLVNGRQIRLVYAPRIESSGYITFNLSDMVKVAGRPIFAALHELLYSDRMFGDVKESLPAILENSRKYQNVVSTQLAGQVLEALYELLRGFQAAHDQSRNAQVHGGLLDDILARDPNLVYAGLLTTLLRLVFLLYAEDRGLLSTDPVYANYYSVTGLYESLRADAGRYPDTMYQRYGAWAQLLALFRLVYEGGSHGGMRIPPREGYLFDPDRYPFLEGRRQRTDEPAIPRVSDGVLYHVLSKLMVLDGERLSYRTLAVEQIGSVYETIMGFDLHVAAGRSIAIKPAKKHGAPATVNLEGLLAIAPDKRQKWMADNTDQKLTGAVADALKAAQSIDDLLAALERRIARAVTPNVVPSGAMIFQPSGERRRSGSHYTPSALTRPIVEAALKPVLRQLGDKPTPEQILSLKVCDPAMGSGAFLVEACRQLGEALVKAWHTHDQVPVLPPDEDELLLAMRQIASRCLYGVDKNPLAADLAKLSLWLATLAKDHPFTFLDHNLRDGDSLVGLTRQQIAAFHWAPGGGAALIGDALKKRIDRASDYRRRILSARDDVPYSQLSQELQNANDALSLPREIGDAAIAVFFGHARDAARERVRKDARVRVEAVLRGVATQELPKPPKSIKPFHWELEFPEVCTESSGGFHAIIGNPPFAGKDTLSAGHAEGYLDWLKTVHDRTHGKSDLVAHFFRRSFTLLRPGGCFGLISTNTIGQGDTRSTGLRWICTNGGTIYQVKKRLKWPTGHASVVVSIVHVAKGDVPGPYLLDGHEVPTITAYLFHFGGHEDPAKLHANRDKSFRGCEVGSKGFWIKRDDQSYLALANVPDPRDGRLGLLKPFYGGNELNRGCTDRFVLDVDGLSATQMHSIGAVETFLKDAIYLDLLHRGEITENTPEWWHFRRPSVGFRKAAALPRFLAIAETSSTFGFTFVPQGTVISHKCMGIRSDRYSTFAVLQSQLHNVWALFQGPTMKDDPVYATEDCFETYPFPASADANQSLEWIGDAYFDARRRTMERYGAGLTELYNEFHDPDSEWPEIDELRELQGRMDRAVLDAYNWSDIRPDCNFIPEFEDEEDEDNGQSVRKKYRYRWPDEVRDEVLARLLELNRECAVSEGQLPTESLVFAAASDREPKKTDGSKTRRRKRSDDSKPTLLSEEKEEA